MGIFDNEVPVSEPMIEVIYGSRKLKVEVPQTASEWRELTGLRLNSRDVSRLTAIYKAGVFAALKAIESSRGARRERNYLEGE